MTDSRFSGKIRCIIKSGFWAVGFILLASGLVEAQMFAPSGSNVNTQAEQPAASQAVSRRQYPAATQNSYQVPTRSTNTVNSQANVQSYRISSVEENEKKPQIILYMRDFKISKTLNGSINCTMRFYVYSTLKEKITNLSYRLKWPNMDTALAFDDIAPNTKTYFDYSLLGKGCYNMDKAPNVIVNRCRVKGLTQQQCAQSIRWAD